MITPQQRFGKFVSAIMAVVLSNLFAKFYPNYISID